MIQVRLNNFSISLTESLIKNLTLSFAKGWTGISGPNGCGKTTLARYVCSALSENSFQNLPGVGSGEISGPSQLSYMGQLPEYSSEELFELNSAADNSDRRLMALLEIGEDWPYRFNRLSWGEKRRLQLALTLLSRPEVLILDEPENHLDLHGRKLIIRALRDFEGIGIIIGHSRDIMNALCSSTLFLFQGRWHYYPHPLGTALKIYEQEEASLKEQKIQLNREISRQKRSLHDFRGYAEKASISLSKKGISRHDNDTKSMIDLARISGADKVSSRKVGIQKNRIEAARKKLKEISTDSIRKTGLTIREQSVRKNMLFGLKPGSYEPYPGFNLQLPELRIEQSDRILLTGRNGSGKTALIKLISEKLNHAVPYALIPQELSLQKMKTLLEDMRTGEDRGELLAYFSRLGGDPSQLLEEKYGSPGELKKLALASAFLEGAALIIMDEPANHLDIFSIRILERALADFKGALILVSHEREFCRSLITEYWNIDQRKLLIKSSDEQEK